MNKYSADWLDYFYDRSPFESVRLVIQFNTPFKMLDTYYVYSYDDWIELDIWTYADNKEAASKKISNANMVLTYLYGILLRCENSNLHEDIDIIEPPFTPPLKRGNLKKINYTSTTIEAMPPDTQKALFDILSCYSAGIKFMYDEFYSEALIAFFRIFESIGLHTFQGCKKNMLHYSVDKTVFQNDISPIIENHFHIQMRDIDYQNLTNELTSKVAYKIKNEAYLTNT